MRMMPMHPMWLSKRVYPKFDQIVVRDDGIGMSPRTLAYVLQNIGGSSKRTADGVDLNTAQQEANDKSPGGRLLIGKIGIGLFAVAQLTPHFQIITKAAGDDFRTSATVYLRTHDETGIHPVKEEYVAVSSGLNQSASQKVKPAHTVQRSSFILYAPKSAVRYKVSPLDCR